MYIFFDGVSTRGYIGIFNEQRECISYEYFEIAGNESTKTVHLIDAFLKKNNIIYNDIKNIICVMGPGSFTGIRTISLVVNTLAFIYPHIFLTGVNFFDMYKDYPIVKSSSKRDLFVKYKDSDIIEVIPNSIFEEKYLGESIYGDVDIERFTKKYALNSEIDYKKNIKNISFGENKSLAPLYYKKPNIS